MWKPLLLLISICLLGLGYKAAAGDAVITFSEAQSGKTVELSKAQVLRVRLPAQLGTGFSWAVTKLEGAPVRLLDSQVEHQDPGIPGGAETQVFHFETTGAGEGTIDFGYRRPWESDKSPERQFTVHVIVDGHLAPRGNKTNHR